VEDLKFEEDTSRRFFMLFLKEKKNGLDRPELHLGRMSKP
jgi:hypothetical protein